MKLHLIPLIILSLAEVAVAEEKVTLTDVHNCCKKCTEGLKKAVADAPGVSADIKKSTVVLTGASNADLQKAVDAIAAAGYTGVSDTAAKGAESFKVDGDFNAKALMTALAKAGFTGTASK